MNQSPSLAGTYKRGWCKRARQFFKAIFCLITLMAAGTGGLTIVGHAGTAHGALIFPGRSAAVSITGEVGDATRLRDRYSLNDFSTTSLGSSNLGLTDSAVFDGQSATSRASESSFANVSGDSLTARGSGSAFSAHAGNFANASALANTSVSFSITTPYRYTLGVGSLNISSSNPRAFADAKVEFSGTSGVLFRRFIHQSGNEREGSASGILPPGGYGVFAASNTRVGILSPQTSSTSTARYSFTLRVVPVEMEPRWINPAGGLFHTDTNWDPQRVPSSTDTALFDLPGTYTVQFNEDVTNDGLRANGTGVNVTFDLDGHRYTADRFEGGGLDGDDVSITFKGGGGPAVTSADPLLRPLLATAKCDSRRSFRSGQAFAWPTSTGFKLSPLGPRSTGICSSVTWGPM